MTSPRDLLEPLVDEQVTTFVRVVSGVLAVSFMLLGYGPLWQEDAYDQAIFDGAFRFASPAAWGIGFLTSAALLAIAAISGRALVYLVAVTVSALTLAGWAAMVVLESFTNDDAVLTAGGVGLYLGTFVGIIGLALSPRQIKAERPIVAIVDQSAEPVPLRRIG